jgi:type IV fimbrial biogenesis protein FimT
MMRARRRPAAGFTLIELLVTVAVLAVLLRLAVPSFASAILTSRLSSYTNAFIGSVQFARSEAIKRNTAITMCASSDGQTCAASGTWAQGWIVTCPASAATPGMCGTGGGTLVLQSQPAVANDYHFTSSSGSYSLVFPASGVGVNQLVMTVCRYNPPGNQERQITVAATGRTAIVTTHAGSCP